MAMQIRTISVTNTILYDEEIKENMFLCKYFMQFHEKKLYICCRLQMILNLHVIIPFYKQLIKTLLVLSLKKFHEGIFTRWI